MFVQDVCEARSERFVRQSLFAELVDILRSILRKK